MNHAYANSDRDNRIENIKLFMEREFVANIAPRPIEARLWPTMVIIADGSDVHRPFGFSASMYFPYDEKWAFFYSAEVMADATAELTDSEFQDWLRYVRAHVSTHTTLGTMDEAEVDQSVYAVLPEARDLVAKVHDQFFVF